MKFKNKPTLNKDDKEKIAQKILYENNSNNLHSKNPWSSIACKEVNVFSLRLPQQEMQQLKYISKFTHISINTICLQAIKDYNIKALKNISKEIQL